MANMEMDPLNAKLTKSFVLEDLEILQQYYEDMGLESELLPASESVPLPALVVILHSDERKRPRILTNSFIPMSRDHAKFTKYLQFYMELKNALGKLDPMELMKTLFWANGQLPMGCCVFYEEKENHPHRAVVCSTQGFPLTKPIDQGVFTEDVVLFDTSCEMVSTMLDLLEEGKTSAEVRQAMMRH